MWRHRKLESVFKETLVVIIPQLYNIFVTSVLSFTILYIYHLSFPNKLITKIEESIDEVKCNCLILYKFFYIFTEHAKLSITNDISCNENLWHSFVLHNVFRKKTIKWQYYGINSIMLLQYLSNYYVSDFKIVSVSKVCLFIHRSSRFLNMSNETTTWTFRISFYKKVTAFYKRLS